MIHPLNALAEITYRRTYSREKPDGSYETWDETIDRVILHQAWLWSRALGMSDRTVAAFDALESGHDVFACCKMIRLKREQIDELRSLRSVIAEKRGALAGRTMWLGGTKTGRERESSQFNCSALRIHTVYDLTDAFWLLLQGCGVGFEIEPGNLWGFETRIPAIDVVRSTRAMKGHPHNVEHWDGREWRLVIGDSAEAWAKSLGKLVAHRRPGCKRLILDFSQIRPAGARLRGYGWISQGDDRIHVAYTKIVSILNASAGRLLSAIELHDIVNLVGTVLSSRRSAQIAMCDSRAPWRDEFCRMKSDLNATPWRCQSNNTVRWETRPTRSQIAEQMNVMLESGGSEPGLCNAEAARRKCPWFQLFNPCAEIALPNKGFCNLVEVNVSTRANETPTELHEAVRLLARANYRQTCVDLRDGVLQGIWHDTNNYLRLCGVGLTGLCERRDLIGSKSLSFLRDLARESAEGMASELGLPRPKAVTTVKPSGTMSKIMGCSEGIHAPFGRHMFIEVAFSKHDQLLGPLASAGFTVRESPNDSTSRLVRFPRFFPRSPVVDDESAVAQLNRYRLLSIHYADHNPSTTIYYRPQEMDEIVGWIDDHWDDGFVSASFLPRQEVNQTEDEYCRRTGYAYMPQRVVQESEFRNYVNALRSLRLNGEISTMMSVHDESCATGACPVR